MDVEIGLLEIIIRNGGSATLEETQSIHLKDLEKDGFEITPEMRKLCSQESFDNAVAKEAVHKVENLYLITGKGWSYFQNWSRECAKVTADSEEDLFIDF